MLKSVIAESYGKYCQNHVPEWLCHFTLTAAMYESLIFSKFSPAFGIITIFEF